MGTTKHLFAITLSAMLFVCACSPGRPSGQLPNYWPTEGWRIDAPSNHGFDESKLEAIAKEVEQSLPFLDGLIIIRDGYIVCESYFNGYESDTLHDIASVTKSWTSALVGMAQDRGELTNLDEPIGELLPEYFVDGTHDDKRGITLEHLLTMRSGIEFDESVFEMRGYGGDELLEGDVTKFALEFPMAYEPGSTWNYSTIDTQLTSAIFEQGMGEPLASFASHNLFTSMGIDQFEWLADGTGTTIGGTQLSMTPRDMAKLGLLYLHNGLWDGEQIIPSEWVQLSLMPQGESYFEPTGQVEQIEWYGHYWYTWKPEWFLGHRAFQAKGYAGQQVLVLPELNMIIVTTANIDGVDSNSAEDQESAIYSSLIIDLIFPSLTDVDLTSYEQ